MTPARQAPTGPIISAVKQAQQLYLKLRREGVSQEDAAAELVPILKAALGRGSRQPRCDACTDYGWIESRHGARKCTACRYWLRRAEETRTVQQRGQGGDSGPNDSPASAGRVGRR